MGKQRPEPTQSTSAKSTGSLGSGVSPSQANLSPPFSNAPLIFSIPPAPSSASAIATTTIEPTNEPPDAQRSPRARVRHSFDVFVDQLLSLREIVLAREAHTGARVRLGDVVQEALDQFIAIPSSQATQASSASRDADVNEANRSADIHPAAPASPPSGPSQIPPSPAAPSSSPEGITGS